MFSSVHLRTSANDFDLMIARFFRCYRSLQLFEIALDPCSQVREEFRSVCYLENAIAINDVVFASKTTRLRFARAAASFLSRAALALRMQALRELLETVRCGARVSLPSSWAFLAECSVFFFMENPAAFDNVKEFRHVRYKLCEPNELHLRPTTSDRQSNHFLPTIDSNPTRHSLLPSPSLSIERL